MTIIQILMTEKNSGKRIKVRLKKADKKTIMPLLKQHFKTINEITVINE